MRFANVDAAAAVVRVEYLNHETESLAQMARDAHQLMVDADLACKGHAAIRNAAVMRLADVYGLDVPAIADATGIRAETVRNLLWRMRGKH